MIFFSNNNIKIKQTAESDNFKKKKKIVWIKKKNTKNVCTELVTENHPNERSFCGIQNTAPIKIDFEKQEFSTRKLVKDFNRLYSIMQADHIIIDRLVSRLKSPFAFSTTQI